MDRRSRSAAAGGTYEGQLRCRTRPRRRARRSLHVDDLGAGEERERERETHDALRVAESGVLLSRQHAALARTDRAEEPGKAVDVIPCVERARRSCASQRAVRSQRLCRQRRAGDASAQVDERKRGQGGRTMHVRDEEASDAAHRQAAAVVHELVLRRLAGVKDPPARIERSISVPLSWCLCCRAQAGRVREQGRTASSRA